MSSLVAIITVQWHKSVASNFTLPFCSVVGLKNWKLKACAVAFIAKVFDRKTFVWGCHDVVHLCRILTRIKHSCDASIPLLKEKWTIFPLESIYLNRSVGWRSVTKWLPVLYSYSKKHVIVSIKLLISARVSHQKEDNCIGRIMQDPQATCSVQA